MDLPKWNRARVKRKSPGGAQDDAVQQGIRQAGRFTLQRAPLVLLGIVVVGAVVASIQWVVNLRAEDSAEATRLLATAVGYEARGVVEDVEALTKDRKHPFPIPLFADAEKQSAAIDTALAKVQGEAEGTAAETAASLVRAGRELEVRAFPEAEKLYRDFIAAHPEHELLFLAREGLVLALEGQGKVDDALTALAALLGREGDFYRDAALWHQGRLLEAQGKSQEALASYKQYIAEYPLSAGSVARESVQGRLRELAPDLVPEEEPGALP